MSAFELTKNNWMYIFLLFILEIFIKDKYLKLSYKLKWIPPPAPIGFLLPHHILLSNEANKTFDESKSKYTQETWSNEKDGKKRHWLVVVWSKEKEKEKDPIIEHLEIKSKSRADGKTIQNVNSNKQERMKRKTR